MMLRRSRNLRIQFGLAVFASFAAVPCTSLAQPVRVPMTAAVWHRVDPGAGTKTDVSFLIREGFPQGLAMMKAGAIATDALPFRDVTIECDLKPLAEDIPGIRFRADHDGNAEEFYLRTGPDCRASDDCIQYAPAIHGFMLWNIYPEYQTAAPVLDGWNHVKLVVSGQRMQASINGIPVLAVGKLASG